MGTTTFTVKNHRLFVNFSRSVIASLFLLLLTACGGGGGDGGGEPPAQPQNVQVLVGNTQVTLSWDNVSTATAYDVCSATETITQPENCSVHQNGTSAIDQTSPAIISGLSNGTEYFFVVIPKNAEGDGTASAVVSTTVGPAVPTPTGKLNDTGINLCGDYASGSSGIHNNDLTCNLTFDSDGDPIPVGQDALSGPDANPATNNDNDGHKGFSYRKLDSNGFALSDQSAITFSCIKDNVTGLIWEVKQTAAGLHNKDDVYTWLNTDAATNGGDSGTANTNASCEGNANNVCNTQAYVARVNIASLCGATNWRLPTRKELGSLVSYDRATPAIDTVYFPNTNSGSYWSSSPFASFADRAWLTDFRNGTQPRLGKNSSKNVRLVRSE